MIDALLRHLIASTNDAADDVLVDALRVGNVAEQRVILGALLARNRVKSLRGVVGLFAMLPDAIRDEVVANVRAFHGAIREAARGESADGRLGACAIVAAARQGKLAYVLNENLMVPDESVARAAAAALHGLARWVGMSVRALQSDALAPEDAARLHAQLNEDRPEIEACVVRALEVHRGAIQQELLNAALQLCDGAASPALRVLNTTRHGGQGVMIRRIQQSPEAEHVAAFLLGATHGHLRSHFGVTFAKVDAPATLAAVLTKTHWLKDAQAQLCVRQVTQGAWWGDAELSAELGRRTARELPRVAQWVAHSGINDEQQDARLDRILTACGDDVGARLGVLRSIVDRPRDTSVALLKRFLRDPDERLARMAVREFVRRRPADYENALLPLMTDAPASVRQVVGRAIGQQGFETFWDRYDRMDKSTRRAAGAAMLKLLPDAAARLARRLGSGGVEQRVKALGIVRELGLVDALKTAVLPLCAHPNPRVRSKAVTVLGQVPAAAVDVLIEKVVTDPDPRVRANAVEVMEQRGSVRFVPLLTERARLGDNRERANAIKALHTMKVGVAAAQLLQMLRDDRPEHRVSALWALRKIGWWRMLAEVARLAREDTHVKVRQYAMDVLQSAAGEARLRKAG